MKTLLSSAIILSALAGSALAQPTYVSGLAHTSTGNAVLGQPQGRRLPVHNIGSSGQDGVEINLRSTVGGGCAVDVGPFLATAGSEIKIKHKGWDGLIYGNHRVTSNGSGTAHFELDYTGLGVSSINIKILDDNGGVISDENFPGPLVAKEVVPNFTCPNGGFPVMTSKVVKLCNICPWITVYGWACVGPNGETGFYTQQGRMIITPTSAPGTPPMPPYDSAMISGGGLPSLTVSEASIDTLGVPAWGVGQGRILEECDDLDGDGTCEAFPLSVTNLGSTGQDGVALDLGPDSGGFDLEMSKAACCNGHRTILKAFDDQGGEQSITRTNIATNPDGSTVEMIDADFSDYGATGYVVTMFGGTGGQLGDPVAIIAGGGRPVWTNRCPPGEREIWSNVGTPGHPTWVFEGCGALDRLDFAGGLFVEGVASFTITPLGQSLPNSGKIRHVVITRNGSEMELHRVVVRPPNNVPTCGTSDFNGDEDFGTDADIEAFFACLGGSCCTTCYEGGSDFNADGDFGTDADIESFFRVLGGGNC